MGHGVFTYDQKDINRKIQSAKGNSVAIIHHAGVSRHITRKNIMLKIEELIGPELDWAVAKCEGPQHVPSAAVPIPYIAYSTDWAFGGPIIEREGINMGTIDALNGPYWEAHMPYGMSDDFAEGPTPLIAAMRCYVMSQHITRKNIC